MSVACVPCRAAAVAEAPSPCATASAPSVAAPSSVSYTHLDVYKRQRLYRVIYQAIEEINAARVGLLSPDIVEEDTGIAEVRETFKRCV